MRADIRIQRKQDRVRAAAMLTVCLALCAWISLPAHGADGYVYSSFTGDGEDGLHLLTSLDGISWRTVAGYASMYQQTNGLMRDPSICLGGDNKYHLVWTAAWWDHRIGISHSANLRDWETNRFLYIWADYTGPGDEQSDGSGWPTNLYEPVPRNAYVKNCWAPEIFYDDQTKEYVIFWSTTIDSSSVFPQTWDPNRWEHTNHRVYYITTTNFVTFTPRKFFYAPADRVVIDAMIRKTGTNSYRMVIKDELAQTLHVCVSKTNLTTWASMPTNFWGAMSSPAFTGAGIQPDNTAAEGPSAVPAGSEWLIYCDYWQVGRNGLFSTENFVTMTRITGEFSAPLWVRHGTVFKAPVATVEALNPGHPAVYARAIGADTITINSARLKGQLTYSSNTNTTYAYVYWGSVNGGQTKSAWQNCLSLGIKQIGTNFYPAVSNIVHKTQYYFSVYGSNNLGSGWSSVATFQTLTALDVLTTNATEVGMFSAMLNGRINPRGTAAFGWFEYGTTTNYGTKTTAVSVGSGSAFVTCSNGSSGLSLNTLYHFRACGSNIIGVVDAGSNLTFQTRAPIETLAATGIAVSNAMLNGSVCPNGIATFTWFEYGTTTNYSTRTALVSAGNGSTIIPCSNSAGSLSPNSVYHFRAMSSNVVGTVSTGVDMTFQTLPAATMLTYNFDDGTLQGWTTVSSDPGNSPDPERYSSGIIGSDGEGQGGTLYGVVGTPWGGRDNAHKPLWIRSPQFSINQSGNLTLWLWGGTGLGGWPGTLATMPTNAAQIPLGVDSTLSGVMGVALRDTTSGAFVLTGQRSYSDASYTQIVWDVSALLNNGRTYTVEMFDYHSGNGWSHIKLDTVTIPGTPGATPFVDITNDVAIVNSDMYAVAGTNNAYVVGSMWISNALNGTQMVFAANTSWVSTPVKLGLLTNMLYVFGSNAAGYVTSDSVMVMGVPESTMGGVIMLLLPALTWRVRR